MRTSILSATIIAFLSILSNASSPNSLPKCASECNIVESGCAITDVACLCKATAFIDSIICCVAVSCSPIDAAAGLLFAGTLCQPFGVTFGDVATQCKGFSSPALSAPLLPSTSAAAVVSGITKTPASTVTYSSTTTLTSTSCSASSTGSLVASSTASAPALTTAATSTCPVCPTTGLPMLTSYITIAGSCSSTSSASPTLATIPTSSAVTTAVSSLTVSSKGTATPPGTAGGVTGTNGTTTTTGKPMIYTPGSGAAVGAVPLGMLGLVGIVMGVML